MKLISLCLALGLTLLAAGCGKREITPLQRKQASALVSEADFAASVRDYARAEGLLAQATTLCPDAAVYWVNLGTARMKLGQRSSARDAYKHALSAFEDAAAKDKQNVELALQQVYVLALLGRPEDARKLQDKLAARFPNDRAMRSFIEDKQLDHLLADPKFKETAL